MVDNIKSVFVGITEEGREETSGALDYALSLAAQAGAHLTVQAASVKLALTHAMVSTMAASLVATENRRLSELTEAVSEQIRGNAAAAGVGCTVETPQLAYRDLLDAFVKYARVHDLTVLDGEPETVNIDRGLIEQLVFESGRPLIIVPPGVDTFSLKRVMLAWDGSAPAARAVNDALPFLRAAEAVDLVSLVRSDKAARFLPGAELAPHLARHGVNVTLHAVPSDGDIAETLAGHAATLNADLLVVGAFNHSLLREWVIGGVTQALLKECKVPLFLSH